MDNLKARYDMSFKAKTIGFTAVALIVVGGGAYTFMSNDDVSSPDSPGVASSVETAEQTDMAASQDVLNDQDQGKAEVPVTAEAKQATEQVQPASQPPKTLTKKQLLPPPATEAEKLEMAAQQESNF
jgi:hypothetical protein